MRLKALLSRAALATCVVALGAVLLGAGLRSQPDRTDDQASSIQPAESTTTPPSALPPPTTATSTTTTTTPPPPPPPPPPADAADPRSPGIVFEHNGLDIADAAVIWDGATGVYRLYQTNHVAPDPLANRNVPMWTSPNLRDWTLEGDALPVLPVWARPGRTWAPDIRQFGDRWVLYSTVWDAPSGRECISYASAASASGPFVPDDNGPLVCQLDRHGSIDPSVFTDVDGSVWLIWKSEENAPPVSLGPTHIYSQQLDKDGFLIGSPNVLLEASEPWQGGLVESPSMVWADMRYWLFVSGGRGNTPGYSIAVTECVSPSRPVCACE